MMPRASYGAPNGVTGGWIIVLPQPLRRGLARGTARVGMDKPKAHQLEPRVVHG